MATTSAAPSVKREIRNTTSTILSNILRDIQLVKAQICDDKDNIRLIKVHKGHVTLSGFIAGAKDAFPREEFPMWSSSVLVQYRDNDDDFVTLRDDMEIQMLDLQSVLGETILKFVPLDENNQRIIAASCQTQISSQVPVMSQGMPSSSEVQNILKRVANTENMVKQLSFNFGVFREKILQDVATITTRLEALGSSDNGVQGSTPFSSLDTTAFLDPNHLPNVLPWCPPLEPYNNLPRPQMSSHSSSASFSSNANVSHTTPPSKGVIFWKFAQALQAPGPEEKEVLMGKGTAKLYVSRDVLSRAIAAGETAEKGSGCIEFAKTIMRLTAQESCGIHLGLVLQDLQKSTNGEIVQSFCSSAGNFIMKILHQWTCQRWPEHEIKKNKFTQLMNLWIRSVFHDSFIHSAPGRKR